MIRPAPEYCYRVRDLPEDLQRDRLGLARGLKGVYNAHIAHAEPEKAVEAALQWEGKQVAAVAEYQEAATGQ